MLRHRSGHTSRTACALPLLLLALAAGSAASAGPHAASTPGGGLGHGPAAAAQGGGRSLAAAGPRPAAVVVNKPDGQPFDPGVYSVQEMWVDPVNGDDARDGASRATAKRNLFAAWDLVPAAAGARGVRIRITPGTVTIDSVPNPGINWWADRQGSRAAPNIVEAADGPGTVTIAGANIKNVTHLYFKDIRFFSDSNNVFHCELCTNIWLKRVTIAGDCPAGVSACGVQEAAKFNQCTGVWVEDSTIYNGWNAAFDCMVCQYGHLLNSIFHHAAYCAFVKGGAAYWVIAGNEAHHCTEMGLSAGQGAGFNYMVAPWATWDQLDVKIYNNFIHDCDGPALSVWGCYNCFLAHNTMARVGRNPGTGGGHLIGVYFNTRGCTGGEDEPLCRRLFNRGAWGPPQYLEGDAGVVRIPNRNVYIANNLAFNPSWTGNCYLLVDGEADSNYPPVPDPTQPPYWPRMPLRVATDTNLRIRGNVFFQRGALAAGIPLVCSFGETAGCGPSNPTCNEGVLRRDNYFNTLYPRVEWPTFRPAAEGTGAYLGGLPKLWGAPLWNFGPWAPGASAGVVPPGTTVNAVPADRAGALRALAATNAPGAYVAPPLVTPPTVPPPPPRAEFWLPEGQPYDIGSPVGMQHVWVSPGGNNAASGASRAEALATLAAALGRIPRFQNLTQGFHMHLTAGTFAGVPYWLEGLWGTRAAPIIIQSEDGRGSAMLTDSINMKDIRYTYFINLTLQGPNDPFHCEACTHILLRGVTARGLTGAGAPCLDWDACPVQETIKMNQCKGVWLEDLDVSGANDNAFDCVACQYGHILNSRFSYTAWGVYVKGGSAYWLVSGNRFDHHGTVGFTAGQGTGFEFMVAPWLQYEAYGVKFINNIVHDIEGAGFGAYGCYGCLYAHNTLVRVGARSHTVEVELGGHGCDGYLAGCITNYAAGGWGPTVLGDESLIAMRRRGCALLPVRIPNRYVYIANNLVYNPPGFVWTGEYPQHLQVRGPDASRGAPRLPATIWADDHLVFRGNVFWNSRADMPLGPNGCNDTNPTCNDAQLLRDNAFNTFQPDLDLVTFRPLTNTGPLATYAGLWSPIAPFGPWDAAVPPGPPVPPGVLANAVAQDMQGPARTATRHAPGAVLPPA